MPSVSLTGVSALLIKETMHWQVAPLPTLVIGPLRPNLSPKKITHLILFFSLLCLVPSSYLSFSETCQWAGRNARLCEIMIKMDGDEGKGVAHFPTSLWWSGNAVRLQASHDATGVYFRQPQSEEPVLQSLMMWGGDGAILWQVSACACVCLCVFSCVSTWAWVRVQENVCLCKCDLMWKRKKEPSTCHV